MWSKQGNHTPIFTHILRRVCALCFLFTCLLFVHRFVIEFCSLFSTCAQTHKESDTCLSVILWPFKLILMYTQQTATKTLCSKRKYTHNHTRIRTRLAQCHRVKNGEKEKSSKFLLHLYPFEETVSVSSFKMVFALFSLNSYIILHAHSDTFRMGESFQCVYNVLALFFNEYSHPKSV